MATTPDAAASGSFLIGGDIPVPRLASAGDADYRQGHTGRPSTGEATRHLAPPPELGVNFIDTAEATARRSAKT